MADRGAVRAGFDAHMIGERETGNETYALGLLDGFESIGAAIDTYAFRALPFTLHRQHRIFPHTSALRIPLSLPLVAARDALDVFHATYVLPPVMSCRTVVTVHDITFALYPEWFEPRVRAMLSFLVPRSLRSADRVITISQQSKRDIVERYGIPEEKIAVTHLAPRPAFAVPTEGMTRQPFFLAVGNLQPRKNLDVVVRALALLRHDFPEASLLIVGSPGPRSDELRTLVRTLGLDDVVGFAGYLSDEELRERYGQCIAHVHPALYEGFGLTPLEAMAQGAPVIAAGDSSIPEVVGDAALLAPPGDSEAWAAIMRRVLSDGALREDLSRRGKARAAGFTWERAARETLAVYREVCEEGS